MQHLTKADIGKLYRFVSESFKISWSAWMLESDDAAVLHYREAAKPTYGRDYYPPGPQKLIKDGDTVLLLNVLVLRSEDITLYKFLYKGEIVYAAATTARQVGKFLKECESTKDI